jgi:tRNA-dihydrouridine synthase
MYSGSARWEEIRELKAAVGIPVIGNGDIRTGEDAARMHRMTGCDGIMIARGSHGRPWIFQQARAALSGLPIPADPGVAAKFRICLEHAENALAFEPDQRRALIEFRKHLAWYTKGLPHGAELRQDLFDAPDLEAVRVLLAGYLAEREGFELEPDEVVGVC